MRRHRTAAVPVQQWDPRYFSGDSAVLAAWLRGRLSEASHSTFEAQQHQFAQFRELAGWGPAASPQQLEQQLAHWVMGRSENGYKFSTIELGIYAVADQALRSRGWAGLARAATLRDALAAARRKKGAGSRPKLPITPELLAAMAASLKQEGTWLALRDACFLLFSWLGMLRGSEALALTWRDVAELPEGLQLFVSRSKTDQAEEGAFVLLGGLPGHEVDAASIFGAWRQVAGPLGADSPVFPVKGGAQPLKKDTMLGRMRRLLQRLGLTAEQAMLFGLHSLRRGGATAAARGGAPVRMIMEHGRWRSDCVRQYMYADEDERWQMAAVMVAQLTR